MFRGRHCGAGALASRAATSSFPSAQSVSASAPGYIPWSDRLNTLGLQGHKLRVNVPPLNPTEVSDNSRRNAYRTAGIVTGSIGLAGIGAGAVFNALAKNADDSRSCVQGVLQCTADKSGTGYTNAATVSFAVGTTLLATGVTLVVLAPSPDKQERHALRVAARVAGRGGRLQLEGVW